MKRIVIVGTATRGGVRSVIDSYLNSGFYSNSQIEVLSSHKEGGVFLKMIIAIFTLMKMFTLLLLRRVSLVHLHVASKSSFWRKSLFLLLGRMHRVPVIIHLHGGGFKDFYENGPGWSKWYIRLVLNYSSSIIVLSKYWNNFIQPLTKTPIKVINNFVPDCFHNAQFVSKRRPYNILFLGVLNRPKGVYDLIAAFSEVSKRFPKARLILGGDGEIDKVRKMATELMVNDAIDLPGWVSGAKKEELMHRCSIFVLPSYKEGLPISIIEAMSCSMAVISTRVGGIPELVDEANGYLISPGNNEELSTALIRTLEKDEQVITKMGSTSRDKYLNSFTPETCLSEMRSVYLSLGVAP
ncbi:MAG: glycosyltransferase family 4 protein [Candidatus Thiodiazotropha sp. (ex. Lucinisca nassula)]|nr:glycosyltransferase family 4 protein [Candidatus Thiodiazotropha sp. (ex. Lucinisca nassula)]